MLKGSVAAAFALTFVDLMKELPITLLTRPFGFETLAIRVFELTSEGEWERAAVPAIALVLAGLWPLKWLAGRMSHAT
jgi:iron(III) transport system permease protein